MHGGFHPDGSYQPPRALVREPALRAWEAALRKRGGAPLAADSSLLGGLRLPTVEQSKVLLRHGLGETFWNTLTITGKIEAKGRLLAELEFPDLAPHIVEPISDMAIGHLNKGLLKAHGLEDADHLLDLASAALVEPPAPGCDSLIDQLWLDGFAEMTPQELTLLTAVTARCARATLAFCLDQMPPEQPSLLSAWGVIGETFRKCHARLRQLLDSGGGAT